MEPQTKNTIAFIDGQNLYHGVKEAFGYPFPNYDIVKLSRSVCQQQGWTLQHVCFYTGVPSKNDNMFWHAFWQNKILSMTRSGVNVYSRTLRYRNKQIKLPDGTTYPLLVGEEKGVDVRIALDIVRMARKGEFDIALVFSQDQDLSEVAKEIRSISQEKNRWIKMASAYPSSPTAKNKRGINSTDWIKIDRSLYDQCIDNRDYRPKDSR